MLLLCLQTPAVIMDHMPILSMNKLILKAGKILCCVMIPCLQLVLFAQDRLLEKKDLLLIKMK